MQRRASISDLNCEGVQRNHLSGPCFFPDSQTSHTGYPIAPACHLPTLVRVTHLLPNRTDSRDRVADPIRYRLPVDPSPSFQSRPGPKTGNAGCWIELCSLCWFVGSGLRFPTDLVLVKDGCRQVRCSRAVADADRRLLLSFRRRFDWN